MNAPAGIQPPSDEQLALKARAGCRSSFEDLVRRYERRLFFFMRPRVGTDQDAQDLVQETFLKAYRNIRRFDPRFAVSTWIYTVAGRLLISHYRKNRRPEMPAVHTTGPDPEQVAVRREVVGILWARARRLPPDQFQALWLRYAEDMAPKEIAVVMKKTQVHVRVLLHRARSRLAAGLHKTQRVPDGATVQRNMPGDKAGEEGIRWSVQ